MEIITDGKVCNHQVEDWDSKETDRRTVIDNKWLARPTKLNSNIGMGPNSTLCNNEFCKLINLLKISTLANRSHFFHLHLQK